MVESNTTDGSCRGRARMQSDARGHGRDKERDKDAKREKTELFRCEKETQRGRNNTNEGGGKKV